MGNANERARSSGANASELPGAPQDSQENGTVDPENLDTNWVLPSSSSTQDGSGPADITRPSSPVLPNDVDSPKMWMAIADLSNTQSPPDGTFDISTQSSNTSFPISESALPTTFDISAEITFSNLSELSDCFVTPGTIHAGVTDQVTLSNMPSFQSATTQSTFASHNRPSTLPPISPAKDALGSGPDLLFAADALAIPENVKQPLFTREAKDCIGTAAGISHPSDIALGPGTATLATSALHDITSVSRGKSILMIQPSALIPESTASDTSVIAAQASRHCRENLAPIDNVISVTTDAVATKPTPQQSGTHTDKNTILASIPLAATYAEAANLAAQHPGLAKEILSRPLLAPPQSKGPVVPGISYAALDSAAQDPRSKDHRRARRGGGSRNDRSNSQPSTNPARNLTRYSESRYMRDEHAGSRREIPLDSRRGRPQHRRNAGDASQTWRQDTSRTRAQAVSHELRHHYADASGRQLDAAEWRPSHDPWVSETQRQRSSPQEGSLSRVTSHGARYADPSARDRSNADEWAPSHDPWPSGARRENGSHDQGVRGHQTISDETRHVDEPAVTDECTHPHDPPTSGNQQQSGSHIQAVSEMTRNTDASIQTSTADDWRPAHDPSVSDAVSTKSGGFPGSHSRVSHNTTSNASAYHATEQWQAPHDPRFTAQIIATASKQYHFQPLSLVQREYLQSQPTASKSSQPRREIFDPDANVPDPYRIACKQQGSGTNLVARRYLCNKPESDRRFSCADTSGAQIGLESTPPEEPRSMPSPPQIVTRLDDEMPHRMSGGHSTEWHKARPPVPTRPPNTGEVVHLDPSSSANFATTGGHDALFRARDTHLPVDIVNIASERNNHISTMLVESHDFALNSNFQLGPSPAIHWLKHNVEKDGTLRPVNPLHSNANDSIPSLPLASTSQNDLTAHELQYSSSSTALHKLHSKLQPRHEKPVHLQLGFDPRAEDWLANPGGRGRGPINELNNSSPAHPHHTLPARATLNYPAHVCGSSDMKQQSYELELMDPRSGPANPRHYAYGLKPRSK